MKEISLLVRLKRGDVAMPTATMSSKGQTVIPKAIRERLGLRPGDALDFVVQDDGDVVIRPALEDVRRLKGVLHHAGRAPVTVQHMNRVIREGRGRR
jgi:AbrB family looped-hinge helix DNA binding protein